jgi:uncharacterized membrane protein YfcA
MESLLIAAGIIFVASILQACTGFGFSIMATPFLLLVYDPHTAIQINIILSIFISVFMLPRLWKDIERPLVIRLVKGSIVGSLIGLAIFLFLDIRYLKISISVLILLLTLLLIFRFSVRQTNTKDHFAGGLSGMLTTSIGMPGPPLLLYFTGAQIEKAVLRSTTLGYYLFIYTVSLGMQIGFGSSSSEIWLTSLMLLPVTIGGMFVGQWLFAYINPRAFQIMTYCILGATGLYLFITSI